MMQSFSCASVGDAPKSPGIYAWYGRLDIGDSDYLRHFDGERDLGELRFRALLARNSQRYDLPDMHVRLTSSFEAEWHATCTEVTSDSFIKIVSGAIGKRFMSTWGKLVIKMLQFLAPYAAHSAAGDSDQAKQQSEGKANRISV